MVMFADEIKKQGNGLVFPRILALSKIYIWTMLFLEVGAGATEGGAGGNNRILLRRMLMKEGQISSLKISLLMTQVKGS